MDSQFYDLGDFHLECGQTLPKARLAFASYGVPNSKRSNAVLLPSWFGASHHGYDFLIGAGKALDPANDFVVLTEMFANGFSSSPSNTPPPFDGPRFPPIAVRDNVEAARRLLVDHLGITHLRAVIGFSMGGQQAYQWAVSHPESMDAIVSYCGAAKTYPHGYVRLESAITAITADAAFNDGEYKSPPLKGLTASAMHWAAWTRSQEWWRREMFKLDFASVEDFLRQRAEASTGIDANNHICHCRTWQRHDVGTTPGFDGDHQRALRSIKARVLSLPGQTDLYFPIGDAEYEAQFISRLTYVPIPSLWGHSAGGGSSPEDNVFLNKTIAEFLR